MTKLRLGDLIKLAKAGKIPTSDDVANAVAQSSGGSVSDGSVTVSKLDSNLSTATKDVVQVVPSKNLFNKATAIAGKYVDKTTGSLGANASWYVSDYIAVVGGATYIETYMDSQQYAWYDSNKTFISGGTFANNVAVTAPTNACYIRCSIQNTFINAGVQFELGSVRTVYAAYGTTTSLTTLSSYPLQVNLSGTRTRIAWKYDENTDFWLDFDKLGQSGLYQIGNMWKLYNPNKRVNSNFSAVATQFFTASSDFVGPYNMSVVNNADGNASSAGYTGGWHGANGDQTGTATARNVSYAIYADNTLLKDGDSIGSNTVKIVVVNRIQAKNTVKTDGTGREVLEEKVTYIVTPGEIKVEVNSMPLEDITITKYMGLQCVTNSWYNQIFFDDDTAYTKWQSGANVALSSGTTASGSNCNSIRLKTGTDNLIMWLDGTYGLGKRGKLDTNLPRMYTETYNKAYSNLVYSASPVAVSTGVPLYWRGGYKFFKE